MFNKEQLKKAYDSLSEEEKDFVSSNESIEAVQAVAKKFGFNSELENALDMETYHTMLGLQTLKEMGANLEKINEVNKNKIPEIIENIKNTLIKKLESLKKSAETKNKKSEVQTPQNLIEDHEGNLDNVLPKNLPTEHKIGTSLEEKIAPHVGTPGQKLSWEERKKQAGDRIIAENKYGGKDPYREPPVA